MSETIIKWYPDLNFRVEYRPNENFMDFGARFFNDEYDEDNLDKITLDNDCCLVGYIKNDSCCEITKHTDHYCYPELANNFATLIHEIFKFRDEYYKIKEGK